MSLGRSSTVFMLDTSQAWAATLAASTAFRSLRFQKVKGTIVDFNELEHALDNLPGLGTWQIELRKAHDNPLDLDELILHVARNGTAASDDALAGQMRSVLRAHFEITPNRIVFHSPDEIRTLQKVGVALKEQRIVDHRPSAAAPAPVQPEARP